MHDWEILGKALLAGVLGFVVGWEREAHGHAAGIRTIALLTMGGTTITSIAIVSFPVSDRVVANILTGVGFLGAGMILHGRHVVRGLTTAASIWMMTAVSIVIGLGHYLLGIGLTLFVLALLWWQYIPQLAALNPKTTRRRTHLIEALEGAETEKSFVMTEATRLDEYSPAPDSPATR
jgi:putative Mg2+ transporter-C (MgtC) family protein